MRVLDRATRQRIKPLWDELENAPLNGDVFIHLRHEVCLCEISTVLEVWHVHAIKAFQKMKPTDHHRLNKFLAYLEAHIQGVDYLPDQWVQLWLPSSIRCPADLVITVAGHEFCHRTEDQVREEAQFLYTPQARLNRDHPGEEALTTPYWRVGVAALGPEDAWDTISEAFSLLRATYEFLFATSSRSFDTSGLVLQSHFQQPSWAYGECTDGSARLLHFIGAAPSGRRSWHELPDHGEQQWKNLIDEVTQAAPDLRAWQEEALSLWLGSRDALLEHDALLACWQTLEHLTFSVDRNGRTEVVIARVSVIMQDAEELPVVPDAVLDRMARARNSLAHSRTFAADYSFLEAARFVVLLCVNWVLEAPAVLPTTEHVKELFSQYTLSDTTLQQKQQDSSQVIQQVASYILAQRMARSTS